MLGVRSQIGSMAQHAAGGRGGPLAAAGVWALGALPELKFAWYWALLAGALVGGLVIVVAHILRLDRAHRELRTQLEAQLAERRRAEAVLEEERNLLRTLIDNLPDFIYIKDTRSRFVLSNVAHRRYLGAREPADVVGKTDFAFFTPPIAQKFYEDEQRVMATGEALIAREEPAVNAEGKRMWVSSTKVPIRDRNGDVAGLVGLSRDITAHKAADDALRQLNQELGASRKKLLEMYAALKKSHEDLKAAQLQLIQAEKMDSVGTLAAGVAHEVKNPLQTILMGVDYLNTQLPKDDETIQTILAEMRRAVQRADAITRGLLDFSASRQLDLKPQDLNGAIRHALVLVRHQMVLNHVQIIEDLASDLPAVRIDSHKIEQVFVNLLVNALHAMPGGGAVTLRTYARKLANGARQEGSRRLERFRAGDMVVVAEVDDTGTGIPEEYLPRLFDPFFTTKPTGKGTGLGLCVARKILELHGASIEVKNRLEGGARVTVTFQTQEGIRPVAPEHAAAPERRTQEERRPV